MNVNLPAGGTGDKLHTLCTPNEEQCPRLKILHFMSGRVTWELIRTYDLLLSENMLKQGVVPTQTSQKANRVLTKLLTPFMKLIRHKQDKGLLLKSEH